MIVDSSARADMGDMADQMLDDMLNPDYDDWRDDDHELEEYIAMAPKKRSATKKRVIRKNTQPSPKKVKAPAPAPTPKANKLELLLKSITEKYPKDPSAPGLAISFLPGKPYASFYGSIRRFEGYGGTKPMIIASCSRNSLLEVMNCLAEKWREHVRPMETTATEEFLKLT